MAEVLGGRLLHLAKQARAELLLVAPYIKVGALARVLKARQDGSNTRVVTRWRLEEIAMGVSDLEVWPLLRDRGCQLWLHPSLHAKYYRGDGVILTGSANLTDAALGWRSDPNLEILLPDAGNREAHSRFESDLWSRASLVDDRLYAAFQDALAAFPPGPPPPPPPGLGVALTVSNFLEWRPQLRYPENLWIAYSSQSERLTTAAREAAELDLAVLSPPVSLSQAQFKAWVALQTRQHPEFRAIDGLLTLPRRFGEVRALLSERGAPDGGRAWQAWMRWMLYFLPDDYEMHVANYSEIFRRRLRSPE